MHDVDPVQAEYRQPAFLSEQDYPGLRIRCPIHGFIRFSINERCILDSALFRRLRWIRQLALTDLLYPGATHTRFEHSLGVMEVASQTFDRLAAKRGDLLERTIRTVAGFEDRPLAQARQFMRLAALLHDVGHACFSHAAEHVLHASDGHEGLTARIIRTPELLGTELDRLFGAGCSQRVAQIIAGSPDLPPQLQVLRDIVSGPMDADRTDYLLRDSHHCGVDYGRFDHRRLIESVDLIESVPGSLSIALHEDGLHAFEALILARYQMNTQVYYHRLRRLYDRYLTEYFASLAADEGPWNDQQVIAQNDILAMGRIFADAASGPEVRSSWARRIVERRHHWMVYDSGVNLSAMSLRPAKEVCASLSNKYSNVQWLEDLAEASIHNILTPDDLDGQGSVDMSLVTRKRGLRHLGAESQVFRSIPKKFQCYRIFADASALGGDTRQAIESDVQELCRAKGLRLG